MYTGVPILIEVGDASGGAGGGLEFQFSFQAILNDNCGAPTVIPADAMSFHEVISTCAATPDAVEPQVSCGYPSRSHSVWYTYTPRYSGSVTISTAGTNYSTVLAIFTGTCGAPVEVACVAGTSISCLPLDADVPILIEVADQISPGTGGDLVFDLVFDPVRIHWNENAGELLQKLAPDLASWPGVTDMTATLIPSPNDIVEPETVGWYESFLLSDHTLGSELSLEMPDGVVFTTGRLRRTSGAEITCANEETGFCGGKENPCGVSGDAGDMLVQQQYAATQPPLVVEDGAGLELQFKTDCTIRWVRFKMILASDEFPEYATSQPTPPGGKPESGAYTDTFGAFLNGYNVALLDAVDLQGKPMKALVNVANQVIKLNNNTSGIQQNNSESLYEGVTLADNYTQVKFAIEYDGFAAREPTAGSTQWRPLTFQRGIDPPEPPQEYHSLRLVVTDLKDALLDTAAFVSSLEFVTCHCPPQDADGDGDVDLTDFGEFQSCFNGPNRPYADLWTVCFCLDADRDGDVDLNDFSEFQACFNGPNRPPACGGSSSMNGPESFALDPLNLLDGLDSFDVTFDLLSPQAGQTITAGDALEWHVAVSVAGGNQGLGGCNYSLFLGPDDGPGPGLDGVWGTDDDENLVDIALDTAWWSEVYAVAGAGGKPEVGAEVRAGGSAGGPGMNVLPSTGYNSRPGTLLQIGTGHLDWDPWRYATTPPPARWRGTHTWGVGLADRKDELLLDIDGDYELSVGWIDTTNLAPGHYVLVLVPGETAMVLRPDVDLSVPQIGSVVTYAASVSGPVSTEFDVTAP